jgi:catechol 2,3-dioxygenase-like lactoylglutathione lyase family enzyme
LAGPISKVDVVAIPSTDPERSWAFYVDTLGLRPDENARFEFWAGETCVAIWQPAQFGVEYRPPDRHPLTLHKRYAPYAGASS